MAEMFVCRVDINRSCLETKGGASEEDGEEEESPSPWR